MKNIYVIALAAILFQGCGQKKRDDGTRHPTC